MNELNKLILFAIIGNRVLPHLQIKNKKQSPVCRSCFVVSGSAGPIVLFDDGSQLFVDLFFEPFCKFKLLILTIIWNIYQSDILQMPLVSWCQELDLSSCMDMGFSQNLICSSCKDLRQYKLDFLESGCKSCCKEEQELPDKPVSSN